MLEPIWTMVQEILNSLPLCMMVGIVVVVGISQLNRIIGGILGVAFWIAVAILGGIAYDQGGGIGFPGFKFPRELFYGVCALIGAFHAFTAYAAYARKQRSRYGSRRSNDDEHN